ncbi:MAG: hypothetical protein JOZ38_08320 [Candidatus Eremiobacteraeota bacterium]|nr:hypothetical protein [Candidatus Eremiobacteraeota bacterium]
MSARALLAAGLVVSFPGVLHADPASNQPAPQTTNAPVTPAPTSSPVPSPLPTATATPTPVPLLANPPTSGVAIGATSIVHLLGVYGNATATVLNPALLDASVDQGTRILTLSGKALGDTAVVVSDARGMNVVIPVHVAYSAGTIADEVTLHLTGDPASAEYVRERAALAAQRAAQPRAGATIVAPPDGLSAQPLAQDDIENVDVPVILQGSQYFTAQGTTRVIVQNRATPRVAPDQLMVSDYPETLTANGELFTADLTFGNPSRFLYFHYNPPGQPDRRIVLRLENPGDEPALVQIIGGGGGPGPNEMEVGHRSTQRFLSHLAQNEGQLYDVPAKSSINAIEHDLPARSVVAATLQLRVLSGGTVHLTLFAQNASDSPDAAIAGTDLLTSSVRHARGVYRVPEFYYNDLWNVTDPYLQLSIGQIPLPNLLQGEALSGDYGVMQSFSIHIVNPTSTPQAIAIYENPRGGRATATFLIDRTIVQSHGTPAFSRYKVRQYTVPAQGYINVDIVTMPDAGSSYPLRLEFAPDDGSVAPGAPGSPIY